MNRNFNTLAQYTIKYLLIPSVFFILPRPIQAEDKIIDGIKIRFASSISSDAFRMGDHSIAETDCDINCDHNIISSGSAKFPLTITFPETASSWTFRQTFFDFVNNQKNNNIPPDPETPVSHELTRLEDSDGTSFNMTQKNGVRIYLKENFLPKYLSSSQLSNLPTDWAISYDVERSLVSLGYMWGVFLPIGEMHRLFKVAFGIGIGRLENKIKINLCDMYNVKVNYQTGGGGKKEFIPPHEGKCINPNRLANFSYVTGVYTLGFYLSLWERKSKDSVWNFWTVDEIIVNGDRSYESIEPLDGKKVVFSQTLGGFEIFSYTYRF